MLALPGGAASMPTKTVTCPRNSRVLRLAYERETEIAAISPSALRAIAGRHNCSAPAVAGTWIETSDAKRSAITASKRFRSGTAPRQRSFSDAWS